MTNENRERFETAAKAQGLDIAREPEWCALTGQTEHDRPYYSARTNAAWWAWQENMAAERERLLAERNNADNLRQQVADQMVEIERLRDELMLCCELKRTYQEHAAAERERWAERDDIHTTSSRIYARLACAVRAGVEDAALAQMLRAEVNARPNVRANRGARQGDSG